MRLLEWSIDTSRVPAHPPFAVSGLLTDHEILRHGALTLFGEANP